MVWGKIGHWKWGEIDSGYTSYSLLYHYFGFLVRIRK
jgi:hypothetical protein